MNPRYFRYYTYIKPLLKNKALQSYSYFVFSVLASIIFAVFALHPTLKTIFSLQKSTNEQQQILQQLNTKAQNLSLGRKNYEGLDEETKVRLMGLLPNSLALPKLINDLSNLSDSYTASISAIQVQPVDLPEKDKKLSKKATLQEISFTINLQATYPQLVEFLNNLTRFKRLIYIESVNFNRPSEGSLVMSVNAKAYYLKN